MARLSRYVAKVQRARYAAGGGGRLSGLRYSDYNFLYSYRDYDISVSSTEVATKIDKDIVPDDAMHRAKLGTTYTTDSFVADLALFLVGGSAKWESICRRHMEKSRFNS